MSRTLTTILIVLLVLVLAVGIFFAGTMFARSNAYLPAMMSGWGRDNSFSYGPGMMEERGGQGMMRGGMMGGYGYNVSNPVILTIAQAKAAAEDYLANLNNPDLEIAEIMVFDNNAYVAVKETGTGLGAFELLVDPVSRVAYPEYGPNMMWNLKYGGLNHQYMMGGRGYGRMGSMMGGYGPDNTVPADVSTEMNVTSAQAIQYAQKFLDANVSGAKASADPIKFYGYYTLDFEKDGKVAGMLSVNGYSGQVFLHTWHGTFIEESEME